MRWWLEDPSGLLTRLLPLVTTLDDAASFLRYFAACGQVLTAASSSGPCLTLGVNEVAALLSFEFEERAGVDLKERYRWYGATPGEHGVAIVDAAQTAPVDRGWTGRLRAADLQVVDRREGRQRVESTFAIVLSTEDI